MKKRFLDDGEELGIPWDKLADGRPHRLKRKRDFADINPRYVREAAKNAAGRMEKGVQVLADKLNKDKYVWVQFVDHEIHLGDPCPCGGRRLLRFHPQYARCATCNAQLLLSGPRVEADGMDVFDEEDDEDEEERPQPADVLLDLSDVHLSRVAHSAGREVYRGWARRGPMPVLLLVHFQAAQGELMTAKRVSERTVAVQMVPLQQLEDLLDVQSLTGRADSEWDLVL